jgi:[ribosomal protein S5]-alanine N-acetyltransferase
MGYRCPFSRPHGFRAEGFTAMKLHRVKARTIADNHRSVRLLERLGFRCEGTLREHSLEDDQALHGNAVYGLLRTDR